MSSWRNSSPLHQYPSTNHHHQPSPSGISNGSSNMTHNYNNNNMENGPRAKCDQVVFEAIAKAAEIVVGSRCWIDSSSAAAAAAANSRLPSSLSGAAGGESSSSRRFNLLVPEVQGVRTILQRWKRALHVPLRLDVYYQHPDSTRELLERWCLEYAPKSATHHPTASFQNPSTDPIVQLRAVCKQIVIWLRSLYCWSRMLPAQALKNQNTHNNAIGFSIYVVSEGNDDVSPLVSQQGFASQFQPHSVWTPYGELGWRVFYAPRSVVERLIPERPPYSSPATIRSSHPIPMRQQNGQDQQHLQAQHQQQQHQPLQQAQSYYPNRDTRRRESTPAAVTAARSAPHQTGRMYQRSKSDFTGAQEFEQELHTLGGETTPNIVLHRQSSSPMPPTENGKGLSSKLSGLSLAMMTLEDDQVGANSDSPTTAAANAEAAEKRRAALHHAPPQLPSTSPAPRKSPLASAGEYGYAYNNQIPTIRSSQQLNNMNYGQTPPTANNSQNPFLSNSSLPHSSTPLGTTPPGYLLGGATPSPQLSSSNLIPPRNNSVTPPFTRPMGFVVEPPAQQPLPPAALPSDGASHSTTIQQEQQLPTGGAPHDVSATTSLDLLHSSPFRQPTYGNIFGSAMDPFSSASGGMALDGAFGSSATMQPRLQPMEDDTEDSMPFAVDSLVIGSGPQDSSTGVSSSAMGNAAGGASVSSSTMIMREMIQPPKRLQLLDSMSMSAAGGNPNSDLDDLASQLAEFKSFGASLMMTSSQTS